jgi:hypothetical protein
MRWRHLEPHARLLELLHRRVLALGEVLLTLVLGLRESLLTLRRLDVLAPGAPLGTQAADVGALDLDLGLDLGERGANSKSDNLRYAANSRSKFRAFAKSHRPLRVMAPPET